MRQQIETNLFGPMNVTRAILPIMREQHALHPSRDEDRHRHVYGG
ncbi:hypothetical protein [Streptomyces tanashiensis]|nr:hypothetical protein [Streptomyces tanashiensis]GGY34299.1 hypothetical protein GCM10010299_46030 [Streptomyces tanashiensis]